KGSAYVFRRSGVSWTQQGSKLVASDSATMDFFGGSVAVLGDIAVIGTPGDDGAKGSAYVFELRSDNKPEETVDLSCRVTIAPGPPFPLAAWVGLFAPLARRRRRLDRRSASRTLVRT